ncbi:MAG TPA: M28 family peptidase, partial [Chthonomonadales bacterium]|nr:M28 family peptidase [Chthonomonadales bacterium]
VSSSAGEPPWAFETPADAGIPVARLEQNAASGWFLDGRSLRALQNQADSGKNVSFATQDTVRLVLNVRTVRKVTANGIGLLPGSDPVLRKQVVVIGAHLDHLGMGGPGALDSSTRPAIHPGADDNASGAAGVMEIARYFSRAARPRRSLLFIGFSGEELGLLGSEWYVKHPVVRNAETVAMLNMDMVGRLREDKLIVIGSGTAKEWKSLIALTNKTAGFHIAQSESGFGASDQQSFYAQHIPVLFFFTGTHKDYHTATDTADKVNSAGEAKVLAFVAEAAERIADSNSAPTLQHISEPQQAGPSRGFPVYLGSVPDYSATVAGVRLNGVREGSPAEAAGLKAGDVIVEFGGKPIKNIYDYSYALKDHHPGDTISITVLRNGHRVQLTATLAAPLE